MALDRDSLILELHWLDLISLAGELEHVLHVILVQLEVDDVHLLVAVNVCVSSERLDCIVKAVEVWLVHGKCDWSIASGLGHLKDNTVQVAVPLSHVIIKLIFDLSNVGVHLVVVVIGGVYICTIFDDVVACSKSFVHVNLEGHKVMIVVVREFCISPGFGGLFECLSELDPLKEEFFVCNLTISGDILL